MLLKANRPLSEGEAAIEVQKFLNRRFRYTPDPKGRDHWRHREEIESAIRTNGGELQDDCDGHAFAAVYALADLGIKARVMTGYDENGGYHAVAVTENGYVIDNRYPDQIITLNTKDPNGFPAFAPENMSSFVEFGEVGQWRSAR